MGKTLFENKKIFKTFPKDLVTTHFVVLAGMKTSNINSRESYN